MALTGYPVANAPREWLEDIRRTGISPVVDLASELLTIVDEHAECNALIERIRDAFAEGTLLGNDDELDAEIKRNKKYSEIRQLCMDAGLINEDDWETDVVPLLRMFLPVGD